MVSGEIQRYLRLLADPCGGDFVHPPYAGTDSGYLIRTNELIPVQATTISTGLPAGAVGQLTQLDAIIQVTPAAYYSGACNGLAYRASQTGYSGTVNAQQSTSFIVNQSVVRKFRPVAACLKFLPSGPYQSRQGLVAMAYTTGQQLNPNDTTLTSNALAAGAQRVSPLGSEAHEIRWLPSIIDGTWTDNTINETAQRGGGTMVMSLVGVDAVYVNTNAAQVYGNFEVTIVWEWTPQVAQGLVPSPMSPASYTTQDALSKIRDTVGFVLGQLPQGFFGQAVAYGVRYMGGSGRSVPRMMG